MLLLDSILNLGTSTHLLKCYKNIDVEDYIWSQVEGCNTLHFIPNILHECPNLGLIRDVGHP